MRRSKLPYVFLGLAAVLAVSALVLLVQRLAERRGAGGARSGGNAPARVVERASENESVAGPAVEPGGGVTAGGESVKKPEAPGGQVAMGDPAELVNRIAKALEAGDMAALEQLIGSAVMDPATVSRLRAMSAAGLKIRQPNGVREVGELELNTRTRWVMELDGVEPGHDRIFLDLKRDGGRWSVEKITLPPVTGEDVPRALIADSLGVADAFLQAVLRQQFELARDLVDPASVSDAKIAALCILFEEGEYRMRQAKPLRAMFQRPDLVGYLANVVTLDGRQSAQFSLSLKRSDPTASWRLSEINLDQLLAEYSQRVAGGDVYYSPLVKNPAGGDTLALYFEFDEDEMNLRTRRQLEIVSKVLLADPGKRITLSGHTDSLGTQDYNDQLSARRAAVVRAFLIKAGVSSTQMVTIAKGASQPRRPNVTETGGDNPEGRRANRRTEIYLDF